MHVRFPTGNRAVNTETFSQRQKRRRRLVCWGIAIPVLAVAAAKLIYFPSPDPDGDARLLQVRQDLHQITAALGIFRIDHGYYPTEREGLELLVREGLLPRTPKDPWSNAYLYSRVGSDSTHYRIRSLGADGREGGSGLNADIVFESDDGGYVLTDATGTYRFTSGSW